MGWMFNWDCRSIECVLRNEMRLGEGTAHLKHCTALRNQLASRGVTVSERNSNGDNEALNACQSMKCFWERFCQLEALHGQSKHIGREGADGVEEELEG